MEIRKRIPPSLCSIFPHLKLSSAHLAPFPPTISSPSTTSPALCLFHWLIKPTPVDRGWRYFYPTSFYVFALFEYTVLTALEILSSVLLWNNDGEIDNAIWYLFSVNDVFRKIYSWWSFISRGEIDCWMYIVLSTKFCLCTKILRMLPFNRS